jgi:hypothetical protein
MRVKRAPPYPIAIYGDTDMEFFPDYLFKNFWLIIFQL